ncbi:hypothetical protein IscW_ISCW012411 [Ixodes scapularis]|uniref:ATP-dependent DNA helicase n=1 Tax=Ixodes scapularis TaxID=6945 RepID=B7QBG5_IXOSC|nr:hypothetical protein IscW_ISCW012411 [Ixodes scapularis]|eukprot:XP_002412891.1 hypothetical protein IscW_ISCW012411 [Ixodes scapularis]
MAIALNAMSHTMVCDEGAQRGLLDVTHSVHVAPGEDKTPISLLFDEYAEELLFPQIYLAAPRKITGPRSTPFTKASSEIRRTDRRGVCPEHVLYMAMKVMRYNVSQKTMTFRTNSITNKIIRKQLETAGTAFMDEVVNRDLAFISGIPYTVQYWQDRHKELIAMIRQLGKPHAFLTLSAAEIHWHRLVETLERLRVDPEGIARALHELNNEAEKAQREKLRKRYDEMHNALDRAEFTSTEELLAYFNVGTDKEYLDILKAGFARPCVLHRWTPEQKFVNAFNPWIAKVLDSNMDLQAILDHYACATYVVDYVNKSDRGISNFHKAILQMIQGNPDLDYAGVMRMLGVTMLKAVEMSSQEAAWFLPRQEIKRG